MRIETSLEVVVSEDTSNQPSDVRFMWGQSGAVDLTSLAEAESSTRKYPAGSHSVDLTQFTQGKFLFLKGDKDFTALVGGESLNLIAGKPNMLWTKFTTLTLTTTEDTRITVAAAGE